MLPGDQLGPYRMIRSLGRGATAEVFLAEYRSETGFSRLVALKIIHRSLLDDAPSFIRQFQSEARLGGLLNHPNIVQTVNFGHVGGVYFLALEHVDGPTLTQLDDVSWSAGLTFPLPICLQVVSQVCDALAFAHDAKDQRGAPLGMIHRDIKPSNIMLNSQGHVKVLDFGIAKAKGNLDKTGHGIIKGTLQYMSPEQAQGSALDHRSDLWSAGVVLYQLITGESLYLERNLGRLVRAVQDGETVSWRETLPAMAERDAVIALLDQVLAPDPARRFQRADDMGKALRALLPPLTKAQRLEGWFAQRERALRGLALKAQLLTEGQLKAMPYLLWETPHPDPKGAQPAPNLAGDAPPKPPQRPREAATRPPGLRPSAPARAPNLAPTPRPTAPPGPTPRAPAKAAPTPRTKGPPAPDPWMAGPKGVTLVADPLPPRPKGQGALWPAPPRGAAADYPTQVLTRRPAPPEPTLRMEIPPRDPPSPAPPPTSLPQWMAALPPLLRGAIIAALGLVLALFGYWLGSQL